MKSAVETLEPTKVKLTVEVEVDDLQPALDRAYKQIAGEIVIPGFRKGKAPKRIIDQRLGRGTVLAQAVEDGLTGWFTAALREQNLQPMGQPEVDLSKPPQPTDPEPAFEFTATFEVPPEVSIPDLTKVKVTVDPAEPTEEEIDAEVEETRRRFASLTTVDRPAKPGDFVVIDLKAEIGGEEIDSVAGVSHEVGAGGLIDGLDEALDGLSADESTTFNSAIAAGPHKDEEALFTVTVTAVKERELPTVDDEWAEFASSFDTVEEMRQDLRRSIAKAKDRAQIIQAQDKLIDHLLDSLDFPAPPGVAAQEAERTAKRSGQDTPNEEAEADAVKAIRAQILLDALAEHLGVKASQEELAQFVVRTALSYGIDPRAFMQSAVQAGELPHFYGELIRNKAAVEALKQVVVEDSSGGSVDVAARLQAEEAQQAAAGAAAAIDQDADEDEDVAAQALVDEIAIDQFAVDEIDIDVDVIAPAAEEASKES
ncbi:MAG: trigger factor [Bifidobacteriaceae bacterium]|nr:trigger factor [Bifidobacteriaceae bacterium]